MQHQQACSSAATDCRRTQCVSLGVTLQQQRQLAGGAYAAQHMHGTYCKTAAVSAVNAGGCPPPSLTHKLNAVMLHAYRTSTICRNCQIHSCNSCSQTHNTLCLGRGEVYRHFYSHTHVPPPLLQTYRHHMRCMTAADHVCSRYHSLRQHTRARIFRLHKDFWGKMAIFKDEI
jgi:hypothetical protein